jgi:3-dehydroquinate synthase
MRDAGLVVALTASLEESRRRAAGSGPRPLLERPDVDELLRRRTGAYRAAHAAVATDDASAAMVAARVEAVVEAAARLGGHLRDATLVALGERTYPIVMLDDDFDAGMVVRHLPRATTKVALVTDHHVRPIWGDTVAADLRAAGLDVTIVSIAPGEASKTLATFEAVCADLVAAGLDRRSAVVALGGGVVGDLAGYVAASLFRGIPVVQLPSTLVAMTDSAIGGKTGVDLPAGKNLVGAFWQPRAVVGRTAWLDTLPERERRAAYGELWKYALLDGPEMAALVASGPMGAVVRRAAALKAWIVGRDERETRGERALLNLGHTVGHAIEAAAGWSLLHGECVALGLVAAVRVSAALAGAPPDLEAQVVGWLRSSGLDADLDPWLTDEVLGRIAVDKKRTGGKLGFVTVRDVGRCEVVDVEVADLRRILRRPERA